MISCKQLMVVTFLFTYKMQYSLKGLCRASQCFTTVCLVVFIIYVYLTIVGVPKNRIPQRGSALVPVPRRAACSSNMFPTRDGCVPCPHGTFSFPGWSECTPWLNCSEITLQVQPRQRIRGGFTKPILLADWKGYKVVLINCSAAGRRKRNSCANGMSIMAKIQGEFVTRLIGNCPDKLQVSNV